MPRNLILTIACPFGDDCRNELTLEMMPSRPGYIENAYGCDDHLDWDNLTEQQDETLAQVVAARLEERSDP